jgi:hypothetical protein
MPTTTELMKAAIQRGQAIKGEQKYTGPYNPRRDPRDQLIEAASETEDARVYLTHEMSFLAWIDLEARNCFAAMAPRDRDEVALLIRHCKAEARRVRDRADALTDETLALREDVAALLDRVRAHVNLPKFTNEPVE